MIDQRYVFFHPIAPSSFFSSLARSLSLSLSLSISLCLSPSLAGMKSVLFLSLSFLFRSGQLPDLDISQVSTERQKDR